MVLVRVDGCKWKIGYSSCCFRRMAEDTEAVGNGKEAEVGNRPVGRARVMAYLSCRFASWGWTRWSPNYRPTVRSATTRYGPPVREKYYQNYSRQNFVKFIEKERRVWVRIGNSHFKGAVANLLKENAMLKEQLYKQPILPPEYKYISCCCSLPI